MFGRNKKEEEETGEEEVPEETKDAPPEKSNAGEVSIGQLTADLEKLKAQFSTFYEMNKAATERFTRVNEQIGELRSMILDRDRTIQEIELKAIKAHDLVESVHPDKIMTTVQREDAKLEALKANLEGNESIMSRVMEELKEVKRKIEFFRGIDIE